MLLRISLHSVTATKRHRRDQAGDSPTGPVCRAHRPSRPTGHHVPADRPGPLGSGMRRRAATAARWTRQVREHRGVRARRGGEHQHHAEHDRPHGHPIRAEALALVAANGLVALGARGARPATCGVGLRAAAGDGDGVAPGRARRSGGGSISWQLGRGVRRPPSGAALRHVARHARRSLIGQPPVAQSDGADHPRGCPRAALALPSSWLIVTSDHLFRGLRGELTARAERAALRGDPRFAPTTWFPPSLRSGDGWLGIQLVRAATLTAPTDDPTKAAQTSRKLRKAIGDRRRERRIRPRSGRRSLRRYWPASRPGRGTAHSNPTGRWAGSHC